MGSITQIKVNGIVYDLTDARVPEWALQDEMRVKHKTEAEWNAQPMLVGSSGVIYVYDDHYILGSKNVPAIKIGDGNAYLIDAPFITDYLETVIVNHISDTSMHTSSQEKAYWNAKLNSPSIAGEEGNILTLGEDGEVLWAESAKAEWGYITGTLSNQTDLKNAIDQKVSTSVDDETLIFN